MTIKNIFDEYINLKRPLISHQTYITDIGYFNNHIAPKFASRDIDTIHYIDYQKFANELLISLKPKTVKNILFILSAIYKYAKKMEYYIGDNIVQYVELPRFDNKQYFTLSPDLQKKYIRAILSFPEPIYKDIFLFLLHGRRLGEVLNLKWEQIDLVSKIMYLPHTHNKSRKNLSFSMTDKQIEVLSYYYDVAVDVQGTAYPKGYIFLNPATSKPYTGLKKPFSRLLARADLPKIRIHDIRHLVATYCVNELDLSLEQVSHALGHTNITTTQRYLNPKPQNAKIVIDTMFSSLTKKDTYVQSLDNDFKIAELAKATVLAVQDSVQIDKRAIKNN